MLKTFADGRLFGTATGSGAPRVLALHGWGRSSADFAAVLAPPDADALDAIALDLPGFGATPPPPEAWGSAQYAEAVAPVLADMATPVVVLAHSFGGKVAVQLAAARPDDVKALVLTGVPLVRAPSAARRPPLAFRVQRALARAHLVGPTCLEAARQRYGSADYRAAQGVMRQVLVRSVAERYDAVLAEVRCPVTLVWGDDDTAAPLAQAEQAAGLLARAQLQVCPGAGHLTPTTVPARLHAAVRAALS